jgi:CRP/FNR family transcriptional regulator, cyclic AMP receptor protein
MERIADDKFLLVRNHDFFKDFTPEDISQIPFTHHFKEFAEGEYVYFEQKLSRHLYFVKEGHIKIGFIAESGKEVIKEVLSAGEIFGQYTLEPANEVGEFARAYKGAASLCAFTIEDFQKILEKRPELALRYSKTVGQKTKNFENRLSGLLSKDVKSRLAQFLLDEYNSEDGTPVENILTHEDMASLIGSSRQTVTSMLNSFCKFGLIQIEKNAIVITNKVLLNQFAMSLS